jgi:glutamate/tyrosine decarboxylase-like PLP-dependent enzyme
VYTVENKSGQESKMPLHSKSSIRDKMDEETYASADLSVSMPKYRFPESEHNPRHAYAVVHDELMLDGNSRQNLATFPDLAGTRGTQTDGRVHRQEHG